MSKYTLPTIGLLIGLMYAYKHKNSTQEVFGDMVVSSIVGASITAFAFITQKND